MIRLKRRVSEKDFLDLHPKLATILIDAADYMWQRWRFIMTITSMLRLGGSGVHGVGRGTDVSHHQFDDHGRRPLKSLTDEQIKEVVEYINKKYPRDDRFLTVIYHDSGRGPHFHFQVPPDHVYYTMEQRNLAMLRKRERLYKLKLNEHIAKKKAIAEADTNQSGTDT